MITNSQTRVLIAEDDSMVARHMKVALTEIAMTVVGLAADGAKAVAMTTELKPDVVLMDMTMPEMDGIAAATAIQAACPTPVVIVSAHTETDLVVQATAAGVGAYVVKPPEKEELERAIAIAIARHADLMELRRVNHDLERTLAVVKTLKGLLPICSGCKKIRDEKDYWNEVEIYVMQHTDAKFTHGLCPKCLEKYFPGYTDTIVT